MRRTAAHQVEAEVADIGAALGIDHHVVEVSERHRREVGVGGEVAVGFLSQDPAVTH
ncbi:hypothetical protein D9M68_950410 [compost metagenome]